MKPKENYSYTFLTAMVVVGCAACSQPGDLPNTVQSPTTASESEIVVASSLSLLLQPFPNASGWSKTVTTSAQVRDGQAGVLSAHGGLGGPAALSTQAFSYGANSPTDPTTFTPDDFTIYSAWEPLAGGTSPPGISQAQASIGRGEQIFTARQVNISGVAGINDILGVDPLPATCSFCHSTPNVGGLAISTDDGVNNVVVNTGVASASRRTPDLPLYTFQCTASGESISTTDPGAGLISGQCGDIGKMIIPGLRNLAARAPYFHDGSAATLSAVVDFYDQRFAIGFSDRDKADLRAFLQSLSVAWWRQRMSTSLSE
jgi:hypothetical protein